MESCFVFETMGKTLDIVVHQKSLQKYLPFTNKIVNEF